MPVLNPRREYGRDTLLQMKGFEGLTVMEENTSGLMHVDCPFDSR